MLIFFVFVLSLAFDGNFCDFDWSAWALLDLEIISSASLIEIVLVDGFIFVLKRSMNPGFAGLDNDIFYNEKTIMFFGDAKNSIDSLTKSFKELI